MDNNCTVKSTKQKMSEGKKIEEQRKRQIKRAAVTAAKKLKPEECLKAGWHVKIVQHINLISIFI